MIQALTSLAFFVFILFLSSCNPKQGEKTENLVDEKMPAFEAQPLRLPHPPKFESLSVAWINLLQDKKFNLPERGYQLLEVKDPLQLLDASLLIKQSGQLLRITISPPPSEKLTEKLSWARILEYFAEDMKKIKPEGEWPLHLEGSSLSEALQKWDGDHLRKIKRFFTVKSDPKNPPLGEELCGEIRKWASAAQLLENNFKKAENRNSSELVLLCQLSVFSDPLPKEPFLELGRLAFPFVIEGNPSPIFKNLNDLENKDKLKIFSPDSFEPSP